MRHIVKRAGHSEPYDSRKLYASVYAANLSVREPIVTAELVANEVQKHVDQWIANKHEVTSNDIRSQAAKHLKAINPTAGFQYLHHRVIW